MAKAKKNIEVVEDVQDVQIEEVTVEEKVETTVERNDVIDLIPFKASILYDISVGYRLSDLKTRAEIKGKDLVDTSSLKDTNDLYDFVSKLMAL